MSTSLGPGLARARPALVVAASALTLLLVVLAVRTLDLGQVRVALAEMEAVWLLPSLAALVVAFLLRALRWRALFEEGSKPALQELARAQGIGLFFNNVLPFRAGEAARLVVLHQRTGASRLQTLGTIVVERVYDLIALLGLLALALPWLPPAPWLRTLALLGGVIALATLVASITLVIFGNRALRVILWPLGRLRIVSDSFRERAEMGLVAGVAGFRKLRPAVEGMSLTVASWLAFWVCYWTLGVGFGFEVSASAALVALVASGVGLALPSGPAAVGVFEAAVVVALLPYGIEAEEALSYALVVHVVNFAPYIACGLLLVPRRRRD